MSSQEQVLFENPSLGTAEPGGLLSMGSDTTEAT